MGAGTDFGDFFGGWIDEALGWKSEFLARLQMFHYWVTLTHAGFRSVPHAAGNALGALHGGVFIRRAGNYLCLMSPHRRPYWLHRQTPIQYAVGHPY